MAKKRWDKGCSVSCPCCNNGYETDDYMPFTVEKYDLHNAAADLLAACESIRRYQTEDAVLPSLLIGMVDFAIAKAKGK